MAPGIDTWVFSERTGRMYYDGDGNVVDQWSTEMEKVVEPFELHEMASSVGVAAGGDLGMAFVSAEGWTRDGGGLAAAPGLQARFCPARLACIGADLALMNAGSDMSRMGSQGGIAYKQKISLGMEGWAVEPILQLSLFEPIWLEAGLGSAKLGLEYKQGNADTLHSDKNWAMTWSAGAGIAFTQSLGLRLQYQHLAVNAVVADERFKADGSMWTMSLLID